MLDFNVEGAYPRGRPKKRWMENINNDMKTLNINADLALDRDKWRKATHKNTKKTYSTNASNPR